MLNISFRSVYCAARYHIL